MVAPQITIRVTDLTLYAPRTSNAIVGCVGPATRGPVDELNDFTDEGNFVGFHGTPLSRQYGQRGFIRYLSRGDAGKYVRIAGPNLSTATLTIYAADGITPILNISASSAGTWANLNGLSVGITHNGTQSYNVQVFERGEPTNETFIGITNGIVESRINNSSRRIVVQLALGAGTTFPAATLNPVTGALQPLLFAGGNDGAFASSDSAVSSTAGLAGRRFFGKMDSVAGDREFHDVLTIDAALAGLDIAYGTLAQPAVPGTVTIRAQTGASAFVELSDDGDLAYGPGGAGMGILTGAAGVLGYIDYRTGAFGIDISGSASTFFATGTISSIFVKAATEAVGATVRGLGAYAGNLSRFKLAPGFFNANKAVITVPIDEQVGDAALGVAAEASSTATLKTLAGWIVPGSIVLSVTHPTDAVPPPVYDDGLGGWRSAPLGQPATVVPGTIDYRTGAWAVTTWDPIGGATFPGVTAGQIGATYDIQLANMGGSAVPGDANGAKAQTIQVSDPGGDALAADVDVGAQRIVGPISPGSVVLTLADVSGSPETYYDDGVGGWLDQPRGAPRAAAAIAGAIDYVTGEWSITATASITALSTISVTYTQVPFDQARRALRGTGPQLVADTTPNAAGMNLDIPATANTFNGPNYLDHTTGAFAFELDLIETGVNTFNVEDNGTMTAVYMPVTEILGFGDGVNTVFVGSLAPAPFRREDDRLVAFQAAQAASAAAGDPQVAFATLGTDPNLDHWTQNVAAPTDPDNFLVYGTGITSLQWTGAPSLDEAVFVAAEEVVIHFTSRYPGDIGNERPILTDGMWLQVDADPTVVGTLRMRVFFGPTAVVESFGQAPTLDDLADLINHPLNGSDFVRAQPTDDAGILDADLTASQSIGMSGAFTNADVVGSKVGSQTTGLQKFRNPDTTPLDWVMVPGQWHTSVITALQSLVERRGVRAIGIVPTPQTDDVFEVRDFVNGEFNSGPGLPPVPTALVPFPPAVMIDSSQLAVFAPWLTYLDQYTNENVVEPPDGDVLALVANTDSVAEPWFPIAGGKRGRVLADSVVYSTELEDRNLVYGLVGQRTEILNSIVAFEGRGLTLVGQRTAQRAPTALDRINVRWTINVIANKLDAGAKEFQFELNDSILWRQIKAFCESILGPIKERRGLQDFFVIVDGSTTTAEDIDNLQVNAKVFIKPARATEFLDFNIILTPTGADFASVSSSSASAT